MLPSIDDLGRADLIALYRQRGGLSYEGEGITQLQHAWQGARLARRAGATRALELATWLHDVGHLLSTLPGSPTLQGIDDSHENTGARLLRRLFGSVVAEPVALHVAAKRYLVATQPAYRDGLSPDSVRSLALQGGPLPPAECARFLLDAHARDALCLRAWDDKAKVAGLAPPDDATALAGLQALMDAVPAPG